MKMRWLVCCLGLVLSNAYGADMGLTMPAAVPENVYQGDLVRFPGAWSFLLGKTGIILVSDEQLEALADPDRVIDMSLTFDKNEASLRQICERAQAAGQRTLILAFDHFFAQYRPGQEGKPRRLTPDKDDYVARIAAISKFAQQYGLGLELSLLSPLEIGPGYTDQTGESGMWMHYREGLRDPKSGAYSVELWRQRKWANNKGPLEIADAGVRVFAFRERALHGTPYSVVEPADIMEISEGVQVEVFEGTERHSGDYAAVRVRVYGTGHDEAGLRDRVLVVQQYRTPEMDYFSDNAAPYLQTLCDKYADAGVKFNGLYSDEMHIQQDWGYFNHHDHGEFALRYVSPGLAKRFAAAYGAEYSDFAKYLVYFVHGQHDFANDLTAKSGAMHVLGSTPEAIQATALLRSRYYQLLQNGVVDLFVGAKRHLEQRMGYRLETRAHATWAESPTIDKWDSGREPHQQHQYEYTSNFVWSDTVHQAAAACHDYFKWGDYLTGNGNDHAEGGWLDRDYFGLALGCSTGILNDIPYSYAAHWGMPEDVNRRRSQLVNAYGAAAWTPYGMVEGMQHRDTAVLMLYPLDLVAAEERFGSWMTQYGYANYVTQAKLIERGQLVNGAIEMADRRFTTVAVLFEPFPSAALMTMLRGLAESGGRVVWSGPPPVLLADGTAALGAWQDLTGADYLPAPADGLIAPGKQVAFEGKLASLPPMTILTDFLVDRVYPLTPRAGSECVARMKQHVAGVHRALPGGGSVTALGFRPRDDQSSSLGYESRWWFDTLQTLGAYPGTGAFPGVNDEPDYISRTTGYLACRFPNGAVAVAPHLRDVEEGWPGGFARKAEEDQALAAKLTLPSEQTVLTDFRVAGHSVTFQGERCVAFRVNAQGDLIGFAGYASDRITVDGRTTIYGAQPLAFASWAPVEGDRRVEGGALMEMFFQGGGEAHIPLAGLTGPLQVMAQGALPGSRGEVILSRVENGTLIFNLEPNASNRWLYVTPATPTP